MSTKIVVRMCFLFKELMRYWVHNRILVMCLLCEFVSSISHNLFVFLTPVIIEIITMSVPTDALVTLGKLILSALQVLIRMMM